MVCCGAALVLCFVLRVFLMRENKKRGIGGVSVDEAGDVNSADMTDKEMRSFRYVY